MSFEIRIEPSDLFVVLTYVLPKLKTIKQGRALKGFKLGLCSKGELNNVQPSPASHDTS